MKKLIILFAMLMLLTTVAFASVISEQVIDTLPFASSGDVISCRHYPPQDKMYCFGREFTGGRNLIWTYDLVTQVVLNKTAVLPTSPTTGYWGDRHAVVLYDDKFWGFARQDKAFVYDPVADNMTDLAGANSTFEDVGSGSICCAVDEGTDDMYCVGGQLTGTFKYELDSDIFTNLSTVPLGAGFDRLYGADMCDYDQTRDKLYYVAGWYNNGTNQQNYNVYEYDVSGDTHSLMGAFPTIYANPLDPVGGLANGYCDYVEQDNRLYCFNADDNDYEYKEIFYIDVTSAVSDNSSVELHTHITYSTCSRVNETNTVCMFGYYDDDVTLQNWAESDDVFEIIYSAPVPPTPPANDTYAPTHGISDITGLVIDFGVEFGITAISLVGVLVIIGLFIWFKPKIKGWL